MELLIRFRCCLLFLFLIITNIFVINVVLIDATTIIYVISTTFYALYAHVRLYNMYKRILPITSIKGRTDVIHSFIH